MFLNNGKCTVGVCKGYASSTCGRWPGSDDVIFYLVIVRYPVSMWPDLLILVATVHVVS
jgi:hypothetical protein